MKNLLLIAITFFTLNAVAQEKKITIKKDSKTDQISLNAKKTAEIKTIKLTKELKLDSKQQQQVFDIFYEYSNEANKSKLKAKQMVSSKKIDNSEAKKKITKLKNVNTVKINNKLKDILTPEQFSKYQKITTKAKSKKQKIMVKKN
jgi:Spy/CpxP family protein refolding chaperone